MKKFTEKGIYGEGDVYVLETIDDWDEYEKILGTSDEIKTYCPGFYQIKESFKKYIKKTFFDKTDEPLYYFNGEPVYKKRKIIAIEDDNSYLEWYWVTQNVDDDRDIKRMLEIEEDWFI